MRFQTLGDKADFLGARVRFASATPKGTPVTLRLNGTEDGLAVILPSAATTQALADQFFYGVARDTYIANELGDVINFGFVREAILRRATRSDDSANWVGSTSIAKGVLLSIDTVNNVFSTAAASQTNDSNTSITTIASRTPFAFLAADVASFASSLSTATSNGTALTVLAKAFVRALQAPCIGAFLVVGGMPHLLKNENPNRS